MSYNNNLEDCKNEKWALATTEKLLSQEEELRAELDDRPDDEAETRREEFTETMRKLAKLNEGSSYFLGNCIASYNILNSIPPWELLSIVSYVKDFAQNFNGAAMQLYFTKPSLSYQFLVECIDFNFPYNFFDGYEVRIKELKFLDFFPKEGYRHNNFYLKFASEPYSKVIFKECTCDSYWNPPEFR